MEIENTQALHNKTFSQNKNHQSLTAFLRPDKPKVVDNAPINVPSDPSATAKIDNEEVLRNDLGISTAPPDSPKGPPSPADSDFQIYIPKEIDKEDSTNQHFLVMPLANGDFLATWTTGSLEGADDQHVVISRSCDRGHSWSEPQYFAGPKTDDFIASWGFPFLVPHTGRIYIFYNQHRGYVDFHHQWTGELWFRYSDDNGHTWSEPYKHLRIQSNSFSHADPDCEPNWIAYQSPIITSKGNVMVGFTHIATKAISRDGVFPSEVRFLRFDNILTESDPAKLQVTTLPEGGSDGLRMPDPLHPGMSMLQEPTIQSLSDGRLFCVMRSSTGYVAHAISSDDGNTWTTPEPLRYCANGPRVKHPIIPCPLYKLRDGRFILIFHNNSGDANHGRHVADWCRNRRPVYLTVGRELVRAPKDAQPIMFKQPVLLADNDRVPISRKQLTEIGTYPSLFEYDGKVYYFFADRKHYLLGKILGDELISDYGLPR